MGALKIGHGLIRLGYRAPCDYGKLVRGAAFRGVWALAERTA